MKKDVDPQDQELIDQLVDELTRQQRDLKTMKASDVKRQQAMAELSKLEMVLDKARQQAAQDFDTLDKHFESLGETLSDMPELKPIQSAQKTGDYERLADELEKADKLQFDKRKADPLSQRLEDQANRLKEAGQKELSDAAKKMSQSLRDPKQRRLGSSKLAAAARRQALRQQMMRMLNANKMALRESKQELRGKGGSNSRNVAETKTGSQRWGKGEAGNKQGPETKMTSSRELKKVKGTLGKGDSERETIKGEQVAEKAQRKYRDTFARFQKISEAVLESEPLPIGHRQIIRRYFRSIRPAQNDTPPQE